MQLLYKPFTYFFLLSVVIGGLGLPQASLAQASIQVVQDEVLVDIPNSLTFSFVAESATEITAVTLIYDTPMRACQASQATRPMLFTPGKKVELEWKLDFQVDGALLPGQTITWRWQIEDQSGNQMTTEPQTLTIQDQRNDWRSVSHGQVTVQWYDGNRSFGKQLADIGAAALEKIKQNTGADYTDPVLIVVYPDSSLLQEVMVNSPSWAGGAAFSDLGLIMLAIAPGQLDWAKSVIPHELSHLVVGSVAFNCWGIDLPLWLNEGLAVRAEGALENTEKKQVMAALKANRLPPLKTLEGAFSAYSGQASLNYLQSRMVVDYLISRYGSAKVKSLLAALQGGQAVEEAFLAVYRLDTGGIDAGWRASLGYPQPTGPIQEQAQATATVISTLPLWTPVPRSTQGTAPVISATPPPAASPTTLPQTDTPVVAGSTSEVELPYVTPAWSTVTNSATLPPAGTATPASGKKGIEVCGVALPVLFLGAWALVRPRKQYG